MMRRNIRDSAVLVLSLVTLLLTAAACGTGSDTATYTRDTKTIAVKSGERFTIKLDASPGVGDDWRVVGGLEHGTVKLLDESYEADDPGVAAGSGTASFLFEATQPGTTELALVNCYRCAADDLPLRENTTLAETLVFTVTVS
jgi:inhibitor of cysteine peptidase